MSDPVPFHYGESWHVFYEHNPAGVAGAPVQWSHAVSTNLIDWQDLGPALVAGDAAEMGVWAGSIVEAESGFFAFYTSLRAGGGGLEVQCVARSADLVEWLPLPTNPVIVAPPLGYGPCFRNPHVFREDGLWKMLVGSQKVGAGGTLLLYESENLVEWTYVGVALQGQAGELGSEFESPDLFPIGDRWVLLTSRGAVHWMVGDWDGRRFYPHRRGTCDGPEYTRFTFDASPYYAARTAVDRQGRRLMFGWIRETREEVDQEWSGLLALPRVLSIREDGSLGMTPAKEMKRLRREHLHVSAQLMPRGERNVVRHWEGTCLNFTFRTDGEADFALILRANPRGEGTEIRYDAESRTFGGAPVGEGPVEVEVFVDGSVIEAFVGDCGVITRRTYAPEADRQAFFVTAESPVRLEWQHVWLPCG